MSPLRNIKLTIQYDGTGFLGWQVQPQGPTIQGELEKALRRITGVKTVLTGSGRTDAGVHALGQVANFRTDSKIPVEGLLKGLNSLLPPSIAVVKAEEVPLEFHSIRDSLLKEYRYHLIISSFPQPLWNKRAWVLSHPLDIASMQQAAGIFKGTHDFTSFRASGSEARTSVRTVYRCEISRCGHSPFPPSGGIHFDINVAADGFLRYMVRNMVGILVEIGKGARSPMDVNRILEARNRSAAGRTAPPEGLYLVKVAYREDKV